MNQLAVGARTEDLGQESWVVFWQKFVAGSGLRRSTQVLGDVISSLACPHVARLVPSWWGGSDCQSQAHQYLNHIMLNRLKTDREKKRKAMDLDPEWIAFKKTNVGSFLHQEVRILNPAPFSPEFF